MPAAWMGSAGQRPACCRSTNVRRSGVERASVVLPVSDTSDPAAWCRLWAALAADKIRPGFFCVVALRETHRLDKPILTYFAP